MAQNYSVHDYSVENILSWVKSGEIGIPEVQRPFVWDSKKVRDFTDSLYRGYPVGYLITWKSPNIRLKDGRISEGKKILIDGQQRVTALITAILGKEITDKDFKRKRIIISFNPLKEEFEVFNASIEKDKEWIKDISEVFKDDTSVLSLVDKYKHENPNVDRYEIAKSIENLLRIKYCQIGVIELSSDLDIDIVSEIFIRINSKGLELN